MDPEENILPHKRSRAAHQRRLARRLLFTHAFYDRGMAETVCLTNREDLLELLSGEVESAIVHAVPNVIRGEVLTDARGRGSLQRGS